LPSFSRFFLSLILVGRDATLAASAEEILGSIEASYSPVRHVAALVLLGGGAVAFAAATLERPSAAEWAVVPAAFLVANIAEWALHRYVMHVPRVPGRVIYERHTLTHHALFTPGRMAVTSPRELRFVLMPALALPAMLVAVAPLIAAVALAVSPNAARILTLVLVGYYLLYEALHTAYHLPESSAIGRTRLVRALRRHHATHHDPRAMSDTNFNITFPIADALFGTRAGQ
jgi:sterol desaturase/sphingolipid hydroxylase (fatty acid hydroxylase superfamily)